MQSPEVKFTNLDKIFFPKTGYTKGQMIQYYMDVAPFLLPHLKQRPVTLIRFPDGVNGEKFYEKNVPSFAPPWIKTHAVDRRHHPGQTNYILINDSSTLAWCANLAALELHPFLHRIPKPDQPTHVVFDLDPPALAGSERQNRDERTGPHATSRLDCSIDPRTPAHEKLDPQVRTGHFRSRRRHEMSKGGVKGQK